MDIATILGLAVASASIAVSLLVDGNPEWFTTKNDKIDSLIDLPSVAVVFGGSIAAVLICFPLSKFLGTVQVAKNCFFNKPENVPRIIEQLVSLAEVARREGLLALESKLDEVDQPFVQLGVPMF